MPSMNSTPPSLVGVDELARFLQVPKKTIYYWVSYTNIPYLKVGRYLRFDLGQVIDFFKVTYCVNPANCQPYSGVVDSGSLRSLKNGSARISSFISSKRKE